MRGAAKAYAGVAAMLLALSIRFVFASCPWSFENAYFGGIFPLVRRLQSGLTDMVPLPGYYLLFAIATATLARTVYTTRKLATRNPDSESFLMVFLKKTLNQMGYLIAAFLLLWGYNYAGEGFASRMQLVPSDNRLKLAEAYMLTMQNALNERNQIDELKLLPSVEDLKDVPSAEELEVLVKQVLRPYGYPVSSNVTVRFVKPDGILRRIGISGIYNPFFGDAHVDNALGPLQKSFTTAHELAHAYGVTSEAEANFVAYLACMSSEIPLLRYAGQYVLWRHLAAEVNKSYDKGYVAALAARIPEPLQKDREAIWRNQSKYRDYFPELSYTVNDTYLKLQGIKAGADDYDGFVNLWFDHSWP